MTDELSVWLTEHEDRLRPLPLDSKQQYAAAKYHKPFTTAQIGATMSDTNTVTRNPVQRQAANAALTDPHNDAAVIRSLSLDGMRDLMQSAGYRVEVGNEKDLAFLHSATNGLPFDVRPGNALPDSLGQYADFAFVTLFAVRGSLPLDVVNNWNRSRRFGRLFLDQPVADQTYLVFCMDVSVAGGVEALQLRTQIELWDGLVQQLIPWLREELVKVSPQIQTGEKFGVEVGAEQIAPTTGGAGMAAGLG